jgi:hypothetical protein
VNAVRSVRPPPRRYPEESLVYCEVNVPIKPAAEKGPVCVSRLDLLCYLSFQFPSLRVLQLQNSMKEGPSTQTDNRFAG